MDRIHDILSNIAAQKTYDGKKRNDLKDSDFLFPETRSFPIVTPNDVKDAISNFGRMSGKMSYETFLRKLYNKCKSKGPEFVAALPEASKDKLDIKSKSYHEDIADPMSTNVPDIDGSGEDDSMIEDESLDMVLSALKNIISNVSSIINNSDLDRVKENLTEPWVLGMIAVIEDNISNVHDYVKYAGGSDDNESDTQANSKPGLWENIRKKKEREGKKYKPAKPGDSDRPSPDAWKQAQSCMCCGK